MAAITIRRAAAGDTDAMARVVVDTWFAAHRGQVDETVYAERLANWGHDDSAAGWRRTLRDLGDEDLILLAALDDEVVGVGASHRIDAELAEIYVLYVNVDCQGRGIGRRLADELMAHYARLGIATLHIAVLETNRPARDFYERIGGSEVGQRINEDGPETVYAWSLDSA